MLRKYCHKLYYFLICVLMIAGMHTTYTKANYFADHAVETETAQIQKLDESVSPEPECVVERESSVLRVTIGQLRNRGVSIRKYLHISVLFFYGLCVAYFILLLRCIEEILCLHGEKYRTALIKYIHDIDGKKRMSCLT